MTYYLVECRVCGFRERHVSLEALARLAITHSIPPKPENVSHTTRVYAIRGGRMTYLGRYTGRRYVDRDGEGPRGGLECAGEGAG